MTQSLTQSDLLFIDQAARVLERPGFLMRISAYLGRPIEAATSKLPERAKNLISKSVEKALRTSLRVAVTTLDQQPVVVQQEVSAQITVAKKWAHTAASMSLGAASGAVGGWALALELPVTTTVMMRSMAAMAQAAGFDPRDPEIALEILSVFAYGSPRTAHGEGSPESSFFADRAALKLLIKESAGYIAGKTVRQVLTSLDIGAAPKLLELLAILASRMNLVVGEKFLAQSLPLLGAAGGAVLNGLFNDYYSNVAYHVFGLRRLEGIYGTDAMRLAYETAARRQAMA